VRDNAPSRTAEAVCLIRAVEQRREEAERILLDPYAREFLGPLSRATLSTVEATGRVGEQLEQAALGLVPYVLCRHRFIDDALAAFLADPAPCQVVLLGAGYDSRAWRFASALAGRPFFEVDHPATAGRKARIVEKLTLPEVDRRVALTDFLSTPLSEVLAEAGFQEGLRTFFVWEGVSMYLTREAIKETLRAVAALGGAGSQLAMDFWFLLDSPDLLATAHRMSSGLLSFLGEPITFGIHPEDVGDFLRREGLTLEDLAEPRELARRYVRDRRRVYPAAYLLRARL
jgi:methyltransferase (TIGR00027 family)